MGNRHCPGQHHIYQGLFPYFSRIFPYFSIPMIVFHTFQGIENFQNIFQTFPVSVGYEPWQLLHYGHSYTT